MTSLVHCYGCFIPQGVRDAIERYVDDGVEPGAFTRAVLENNLKAAVGRADPVSLGALKEIVTHVYNCIPANVQGSPEKVAVHLARKEIEKHEST